ncbi:MAG: GNAT family N-acetyltransferase [Anaerolineales bacterium]|nr:GNAT family N-acetyltransferase [Anaerolineales bacterium]
MVSEVEIQTVNESNLERLGFFCYKSKRKTPGYVKKLDWVRKRLVEGMRIHILYEDGVSKGFIESIPGHFAWRAVNAEGYLFIHCMWVVGKAKGKGYGSLLLDQCIQDAKEGDFKGVAVLASGETWLAGCDFFNRSGFDVIETAAPAFTLMALSFNDTSKPSLPSDWSSRIKAFGPDLTVIYNDQCPYIDRMKNAVYKVADTLKIEAREVRLSSASEVQRRSPSPYGVYNVIYRGDLIVSHPIGTDALLQLMQSRV